MPNVFVPTRYYSLSYAENGALILFNSLTGAIGAVPPESAAQARTALQRNAHHSLPLNGILKDLQSGGFLVPEGTNEMALSERKFLSRYRDDHLHLILLPTEQCNFRCTYCYESFLREAMPAGIRNGIRRFVARQQNLQQLTISWFGGEPLLASDVVIELSQFFHQFCADHGIQLRVGATTNAFFLTPEIADQIIPLGVREFQVTIDGVQEEHDKRRVLQHGGGTFARIIENLRYLKRSEHVFLVIIRHNFDPASKERLEEFIAMLKEEFGDDPRFAVFFFPIGKLGGANDEEMAVCEGKSISDSFTRGRLLALEAGLHNAWQIERFRPNGNTCYAADPRSFVIGSDGNLYKCTVELDYHDRNIVGRLLEDGSMQLDWRKMALWTETNGMDEGKKCYTCFYSPACHGACCPKEWLDEPECHCPTEKVAVRKLLPVIYKESLRPKRSVVESTPQCVR
ncbi:MAG: radical SAM protein [Ktedonobacteraceae bacterium]|nr:radical SAM protein [Ktedonobacteraceae bacterium]